MHTHNRRVLFGLALIALAPGGVDLARGATTARGSPWGRLPLSFERNAGQTDASVAAVAHGARGTFYFRNSDVTLALAEQVVRVRFDNTARKIDLERELRGHANYFTGADPKQWHVNLPTYARIVYRDLYHGVQLAYEGNGGTLKSTFTVAANADARRIRWFYEGVDDATVDANGDLHLCAGAQELVEQAPIAWQEIKGQRRNVAVRYKIDNDGSIGFSLGKYDRRRPLTIDPALTYSTYLGGSSADYGFGVAVDSAGNAYVTGDTTSLDFSTPGAAQTTNAGAYDVFVMKIDASGSNAIYSTYLGGNGWDVSNSVALDRDGNAYVTGYTESTNFPTANAIQSVNKGIPDVFITKLNADGSALVYSTYLGGSNFDVGNAVVVNAAGEAYLGGLTLSADFPTANAYQATNRGIINAYISKLNAAGSALVFSTYFGGSTVDRIDDMGLDTDGNLYLTGQTASEDFPTAHPIQPQIGDSTFYDAFVAKFDPSASTLIYSTYLGGMGDDKGYRIAVDLAGNAYVTGSTMSPNFPIAPVPGAFQPVYGGSLSDGFVTKINAAGSAIIYSTYLGGARDDYGNGIAVDQQGNAYVTGYTGSINFPVANAIQPLNGGGGDAFVTKLNVSGTRLIYSTFLGGAGDDGGNRIKCDGAGSVYVAGYTSSANFPTAHPAQQGYAGGVDAFLSKISDAPVPPANPSVPVPCLHVPGVHDHCETWVSNYDNPNGHNAQSSDVVRGMAIDPNGTRVYVIGYSGDDTTANNDYVTVAYDPATGGQLWAARYDGGDYDNPSAIVVSPDGARVFVTGWSPAAETSYDYATIAYDAATGAQLWVARYDGPGHGTDLPYSVAISADGKSVLVTGSSPSGDEGTEDIATIAYNAATGERVWTARFDAKGGSDQGVVVRTSPDGQRVYVTGIGRGESGPFDVDWKTIAYDAKTGAQMWLSIFGGVYNDAPIALVVSPDGDKLYLTGQSQISSNADYEVATVALNAGAGTQLWAAHYHGPSAGFESGFAIAVAPKGDRIFVAGLQTGERNGLDADVISLGYDAATGAELWSRTYNTPGFLYEWAHDLAVSRDGKRLYVAALSSEPGANGDFATLVYDAANGSQLGVDRYNTLAAVDTCYGWSLALSPNDTRLFVSGVSYHAERPTGVNDASSITTAAYQVAPLPLSAVSVKTHGGGNTFNLNLPLTGTPAVECRSGGTSNSHQIVINFSAAVTVGSASITSGTGKIDNYTVNGSSVIVNLSDVANAQTIVVTLSEVSDGTTVGSVSVPMRVLVGDTTADDVVNSADIAQTKSQSGGSVTSANFREDVTADGNVNSADIALVKSKSGTALP